MNIEYEIVTEEGEVVDVTDDRDDAFYLLGEYQLAFGGYTRCRIRETIND